MYLEKENKSLRNKIDKESPSPLIFELENSSIA